MREETLNDILDYFEITEKRFAEKADEVSHLIGVWMDENGPIESEHPRFSVVRRALVASSRKNQEHDKV